MRLVNFHIKVSILALALILAAGQVWGATYYKHSKGTAANKEAATGPCTTLANCMNRTVYAGETFADGDVIVHCHSMIEDGDDIFFKDISRTLSIPSSNIRFDVAGNTRTVVGGNTRVTN